MVFCKEISKSYGNKKIIKNFTFNFCHNLTYLNGKNGSGKSTLLRLISGIEKADTGSISYEKKSANKIITSSLASDSIQIPNIFTPFEVYQQIKKYNEVDESVFDNLINLMELKGFLNVRLHQLSTGTNKKISNILAMVKVSDILLLDEPFNGLDNRSIDLLAEIILQDKRLKIIIDHCQLLTPDATASL